MTEKLLLLCVVFVSSLLVATTLADDAAASSSLRPSLVDRQLQPRPLGGYRHYLREGEHEKKHEVAELEAKKVAETSTKAAGLRDEGLIYSADYSGVAMHDRSPPAHNHHPKQP